MRSRLCSASFFEEFAQNGAKHTLRAIAVLALAFPMAALADFSNTQTILNGQYLNLATGAASSSSSGADLLFSGTKITPEGSATIYSFGPSGSSASVVYSSLTGSILSSFSPYATTPISSTNLVVGEIFAVKTNTSYYAKVLITAVSPSSLSLQYDTFGAPAGGNTPTITAVEDAGSYSPSIAEGSMFVVKGNNLSGSGYTATGYPLPTNFGNVSIAFTPQAGGSPTLAYIVYLYNLSGVNQLAAILPSTVPVGTYNVTVTYNNATSAPLPVPVMQRKPGFITADSSGSGLVLDQNYISQTQYDINRFTTGTAFGSTISPGHPGQTMIAWLTGLGPVPYADNMAAPVYNFLANNVSVQVMVNGTAITPTYAGSAPNYSGLDQIDFVLPANVTTGCTVPVQVLVNGVSSRANFISIAPAGSDACVQPGFTTAQLQAFDDGQSLNYGNFAISQSSENAQGMSEMTNEVSGSFVQYTGFELSAIPAQLVSGFAPPTGCTVTQITPTTSSIGPTGQGFFLDAGNLTVSGPSGSGLNNTPLTDSNSSYFLGIGGTGATTSFSVVPGNYTLNGTGGTQVGGFTASMTLPPPLTVTGGLPSVVNRSSGLTLNWTGGNPSDGVVVIGSAANIVNDFEQGASFICYTTAGAKTLTVSSTILNQLPPISASLLSTYAASTVLEIITSGSPSAGNGLFNAPLTAGGTITNATFEGSVSISNEPAYQ
jgi:uncharacterized protein (TIGR03437 family)